MRLFYSWHLRVYLSKNFNVTFAGFAYKQKFAKYGHNFCTSKCKHDVHFKLKNNYLSMVTRTLALIINYLVFIFQEHT